MKEYEIKINYTGYLTMQADNLDEAIERAKMRWSEESSYDIAKWSDYALEGEGK